MQQAMSDNAAKTYVFVSTGRCMRPLSCLLTPAVQSAPEVRDVVHLHFEH